MSFTYGFIDPELSKKIVKWRNPDDPSYHRWDDGAAVDFIAHEWLAPKCNNSTKVWEENESAECSPIMLACDIAKNHGFSRMITYSESPGICIATKASEPYKEERRAFYENRWNGQPQQKPMYLQHRSIPGEQTIRDGLAKFGWRGQGFPSYHGGGRQQFHHLRLGRYLTLLDCLRDPSRLNDGRHNRPPVNSSGYRKFARVAFAMSRFMQFYYTALGKYNLSIVAGHGCNTEQDAVFEHLYKDGIATNNWETGAGTMLFAMREGYMEEFNDAFFREGRDTQYFTRHVQEGPTTYLAVTWRMP